MNTVRDKSTLQWEIKCHYEPLKFLSYAFLNMLMELDARTDEGRQFQSFAPLTLKKFFRRSSRACGTTRGMKVWSCRVLGFDVSFTSKIESLSTLRNPLSHLKTSIASPRRLLSSSVVKLSC